MSALYEYVRKCSKIDVIDEYTELMRENKRTQALITELEADALARLIEEPTNERIMKDVYEENERLKKAVEEAIDMLVSLRTITTQGDLLISSKWVSRFIKEYGGKE